MDADVTIIGAGVVGLACAAELSPRAKVLVLERRSGVGQETSSRNSGVIHAGIYYPERSLKAETCMEGRRLLYERCERLGIAHRKTGKLIVATHQDEVPALESLEAQACSVGVTSLEWWSQAKIEKDDPALRAVCGLWSPESGLVDAHALVQSYRAEAEAAGALLSTRTTLVRARACSEGWELETRGEDGERFSVRSRWVVNAAGLCSDEVAAMTGLDVDALHLRIHLYKGEYFSLSTDAPRPRTSLVYPVPAGPGLGIHLTTDLGGRCIAGPNALHVSQQDYRVDPDHVDEFVTSVSRYLPGLKRAHLTPDFAGIRPKLQGPDAGFRDFAVIDGTPHGAPQTVHLIGIESPGLTAAGALAKRVAQVVRL